MGVTGLWTVVQPCARPIKLETLNRKRLAVDASIWIYQFLKAVRDKEGNALRNSHVVGFFRRICKLLFFGIKPVFVFDGGAPSLKRQTIVARKARREGRRDDAVRTAGKLLAIQMQRRAEEDDQKRREQKQRARQDEESEQLSENMVYVDELHLTEQERTSNRFQKKDQYHLPNLDVDISDLGAPNDPRIMSHEELEEYARQFHRGEDVAMYDFSKIDFDSTFFTSLPAADRYNILNAARLRSRLRMGYSKEQLDTMFPNRMDFSRFQIERVTERNELTQRLMNLNGMNGEDAQFDQSGRVAGERGKEYVLVKNDGVEGGWALGVVTNRGEGAQNKPINVEDYGKKDVEMKEDDEEWEDDGFEDVPIEGLNRLPSHLKRVQKDTSFGRADPEQDALKRRAVYEARLGNAGRSKPKQKEPSPPTEQDSLFIEQEDDRESEISELFEDVPTHDDNEEDSDLRRAIEMSLENGADNTDEEHELPSFASVANSGPRIDQPLQFNPKNAKAGRDFAHLTNTRAHGSAPKPADNDSDEDDFNLRAGLEESRKEKPKYLSGPRVHGFKRPNPPTQVSTGDPSISQSPTVPKTQPVSGIGGPLPFEALSLGSSILGQRKKKPAPEAEGGFEKAEKPAQPLPPWFSGDIRDDVAKQNVIEETQYDGGDPARRRHPESNEAVLRRHDTGDVIDVDAPPEKDEEVVSVESSDEGEPDDMIVGESKVIEKNVKMNDIADTIRVRPPQIPKSESQSPVGQAPQANLSPSQQDIVKSRETNEVSSRGTTELAVETLEGGVKEKDDEIDWSESEASSDHHEEAPQLEALDPNNGSDAPPLPKETEGVLPPLPAMSASPPPTNSQQKQASVHVAPEKAGLGGDEIQNASMLDGLDVDDEHAYSDSEDEELMQQLATEAEEHARFAASLNSKSQVQNAEEYERELRQLRNQQKKDRRDADEVSHIMVTECQQLLRLFGLPYITAPMEAEAQCATLVSLGLVDGIVTDDSDCFLFGGTRIYKNMFNQAKFVECYLTSDLEKEYGLDREKLIRFAHLLGSDYTEGLPSVGPVTALEILSEFDTLEMFAEWWTNIQMTPKPRFEDIATPFRKKFRKNASKIFLPTVFPDTRVDHAYLHPEVDADPQPFQWGVPDLDALRSFLMATIGWSQDRTDEVLVPVIKDINRRENEGTQANITAFFGGTVGVGARQQVPDSARVGGGEGPDTGGGEGYAPRRRAAGKSTRMENALGRMKERVQGQSRDEGEGTGHENGNGAVVADEGSRKRKKGRGRARKQIVDDAEDDTPDAPDIVDDSEADGDAEYNETTTAKTKRRKRHVQKT